MAIDIKSLHVGTYSYKMPHWDNPVIVQVEKDRDCETNLVVRFKKGFYPTLLHELPAEAEMQEVPEDTKADQLTEFIDKHCVGKQYDTCTNSPCLYASSSGCQHVQHPKNQAK